MDGEQNGTGIEQRIRYECETERRASLLDRDDDGAHICICIYLCVRGIAGRECFFIERLITKSERVPSLSIFFCRRAGMHAAHTFVFFKV